jgi:hypothetical protein
MELFCNDEIEKFIKELHAVEAQAGQSTAFDTAVYERLRDAEQRVLEALIDLETTLGDDSQIIIEAKRQFRARIRPWYYQSFLMKRATEKPLGYPGDYEILEGIYDNIPLSDGFGQYLDQLFLNDRLAVAVRHRKNMIRDYLKSELENLGKKQNAVRILNIASGSCREWYELLGEVDPENLRLKCVDFDQLALNYARRCLSADKRKARIEFIRDNALRLAVRNNNLDLFGRQDLIYSFGLYDYLTDKTLKRLLKNQYELLEDGGRMILTFKDKSRYEGKRHAWFCDWYFEQRTEEDVRNMLLELGLPERGISTDWEKSGTIVFFVITKNGNRIG